MKPSFAWTIKRPDGHLSEFTHAKKRFIICGFFGRDHWPKFYRKGYRIVRVQITETL